MLDLSLAEMGVILITGLLVIGPKELPVAMRKGARAWGKFKRFGGEMRRQFDESPLGLEMREAQREVERESRVIYDLHGQPFESYSLDGLADASRMTANKAEEHRGPTPHLSTPHVPAAATPPASLLPESDAPRMMPLMPGAQPKPASRNEADHD